MKRRGLYPQIADEIERSVRAVVLAHTTELRGRKDSADLLAFWIMEGARQAAYPLGKSRR